MYAELCFGLVLCAASLALPCIGMHERLNPRLRRLRYGLIRLSVGLRVSLLRGILLRRIGLVRLLRRVGLLRIRIGRILSVQHGVNIGLLA